MMSMTLGGGRLRLAQFGQVLTAPPTARAVFPTHAAVGATVGPTHTRVNYGTSPVVRAGVDPAALRLLLEK
eukprot:3941972-Rhodomonas_salina.1